MNDLDVSFLSVSERSVSVREQILYLRSRIAMSVCVERGDVAREILQRDGYKCFYCGEPFVAIPQIEHVRPRARGGSDHIDNLVLACKECNSLKRTRPAWLIVLLLHSRAPSLTVHGGMRRERERTQQILTAGNLTVRGQRLMDEAAALVTRATR